MKEGEALMKLLAPTRGGQPSYPNQDKAISLAAEKGAELYFLYITDISFLDRLASPVLVNIEEDLDEMGGFVLAMAQERAAKHGIEAQAVVRRGHFREVLEAVITELEIDLVILGSPATGDAFTTLDFMKQLASDLAEKRKVGTIVLANGEIVYEQSVGESPE
jgi:nucleotide-binding universal stress UspA family protein